MADDSTRQTLGDQGAQHDESAQKYRALFEQSIDGIFVHDLDGRIVDVNRAAVAQSGFSKDELLRMSVFDLIVGDAPRDGIIEQWRRWRPGEAMLIEGRHWRKDGTDHPVEVNTGKLVIGDREAMLAIVRDITDRVQAEQARRALEQQLRHSQKMEAVGRLAGGIAHDFNNVLCGILGHAELALHHLPDQQALERSIEAIHQAATRAAGLIRQLLAFSRKQIIEPRLVDLGALVETLQPMLTSLLGEDIALQTMVAEGSFCVRADPSLLEQVVLNLAINARDAMPHGGELVMEVTAVELDEAYCASHAEVAVGPHVLIGVSDSGAGMDEETRARIFEPFFTTKEQGKGTGLGLATVYGIVQQAGGRIEVYSEQGEGSSFKVYLPRIVEAAELPEERRFPKVPGGDETLLLVEDEAMVREMTVRFLSGCGYQVLTAGCPDEALELARRRSGAIDLLLTDVILPGMNGRELATRLEAVRPGLPVLYTSGYTENVIAHRGVLEEGLHFLAKPYSLDALARRVREVLDVPGGGGREG